MNQMQKSWVSVILAFIKTFFHVATDATNVIGDGISMAERAVKSAKKRQLIDLTIATRTYREDAVAVASLQRLKTVDAIKDYIKDDASKAEAFASESKAFNDALNSEFAKLEAEEAAE